MSDIVVDNDALFDDHEDETDRWPLRLLIPLGLLVLFVIVFLSALGGATFFGDEASPFDPQEFLSPAQVVTAEGEVPTVENLPPPSVRTDELVPLRITRTLDCQLYSCPSGSWPILVDVNWVQLNLEGNSVHSVNVAKDVPVNYNEGDDYIRGASLEKVVQSGPFNVPQGVVDRMINTDAQFSVWRVESVVTPDVDGGVPAAWVSEIIHVELAEEAG